MPKASKYVSPKNGGLGEEVRELLADLVTRITTRVNQGALTNSTNLATFLTAVQADLTAFNATVPVIGTLAISTDNVVTAVEKASPVPAALSGLTNIKAGDIITVTVRDASGNAINAASTAALTAGATTASVNLTLTSAPIASYTATAKLFRNGVEITLKVQAFTVTA